VFNYKETPIMTTQPKILERFAWLRNRLPLTVAVTGLALLLGVTLVLFLLPKKTATVAVSTVPVTQGPIMKTVPATGKVVSNFEVEIKAKASGKIIRLPYDVSDYVPQGALLVQLDPIDESRSVSQALASLSGLESRTVQSQVNLKVAERTLSTDVAKAKANLAAAQARYNDTHAKAKRLETLAQQRYISQEEAETGRTAEAQAKTDLDNAQTRLRELETQQIALQAQSQEVQAAAAQARAQQVALAQAEQRLSETRIYAPIAGVVTSRAGQIGNIVASGVSNVGGGTAIMTLADLSHIYVLASVDESDIGQVREGQSVRITADSYPGRKFQGRVVRIAPQGVEESNVVTFEVKIEVMGSDHQLLKPAMTTNVEIVVDEKPSVLKLPSEAIQTGQRGGNFVMVKTADGQLKRQPVVVGLNNGTEAEIKQGLTLGDAIVASQGQARSRWRKDQPLAGESQGANRRGQRMMMRSLGGGRR
jgi:HlyD family secretion protein